MPRVLLLLPTATYRAPDFLAAAEKLGVDVAVASEEPSTMEALSGGSLLTLNLSHPRECAESVLQFHQRFPVDAVIAVDEQTAVAASAIGERLGLPHNTPHAADCARLKHRMRETLADAGLPSPAFRTIDVDADPKTVAESLLFPAVLKPVFLSGSRGVQRANDTDGFVEAFERLKRLLADDALRGAGGDAARLMLVESFIPGVELALEAVVTDGELHPLAIFDKPDPLDGPFFEETIYVTPSRLDTGRQEEIVATAGRAASALGIRHGPVHAELRLPEGEAPVVVEMAGRSIGGLCARTLRFGLGVSLEELLLRHALGEEVDALRRESSAAGVMMIPIPRAGTLEGITGQDHARSVEGIEAVTITATVGKKLVPLPEGASYLGFIFARASEPADVEHALREAHRRLVFAIQ